MTTADQGDALALDEIVEQGVAFEFSFELQKAPTPRPKQKPVVMVYSHSDLKALEDSLPTRDSDSRERLKAVVHRMKARGQVRPLATVPTDWKAWLNNFEVAFPNFKAFTALLRSQFALNSLGDKRIALPPVLFDGPPGVGKTEVAMRLAQWLGTEARVIDMATAESNSVLTGSDAHWSNSREGAVFEMLAYGHTANPLLFLDELDKVSGEGRFRADAGLYQLLEPRTAADYRDNAIREVGLDARHILVFAATNDVTRLHPAIRSRFVEIAVRAPDSDQAMHIAQSVYRNLLMGQPWGPFMTLELSEAVARHLAKCSPRAMRMKLQAACGKAALDGRSFITVADVGPIDMEVRKGIGFIH